MPGTFDDVVLNFATDAESAVNGIENLRKTLSKFANATKKLESASFNLSGLNRQLRALSKVATSLGTIATPINDGLSAIDKIANNNSLSTLSTQLHNLDFNQIRIDGNNLIKALKPLSTQFKVLANNATKVQQVINKLPTKTNQLTKSVKKLNIEANKRDGYFNIAARATTLVYMMRRLSDVVATFIEKSVSYTETINLFGVAMGDQVDKANEYVNALSKAFSIDTSTIMQYMGVFQELNTSMGMSSEMAYTLSASFAQLGVDIASLWNLPIATVYEKLESGLTGITRPLKQIGIDVTENALSMTAQMYAQKALTEGNYELAAALSTSIEKWSRVQKQQMIYLTILRQTTSEQGDFARTINSPANQLKIFYEQLTIMYRNIGNIFYETIAEILPYLNAAMMVLNDSLETVATLAGYVAPSASAAADAAEGMSSNFDETADSASSAEEAIGNLISGLDKFTTLSQKDNKNSLYDAFDIDMPDYSSTLKDIKSKATEIYESLKKIQPVLEAVGVSLMIIAAATLISKIGQLGAALSALGGTASILNAQTVVIAGLVGAIYLLVKWWKEADSTGAKLLIILTGVTAALITLAIVTKGNVLGSISALIASLVDLARTIVISVYVAIDDFIIALGKLRVSSLLAAAGIAVLVTGLGLLVANWSDMGVAQKTIIILTALAAAAVTAAIAFAALGASVTMGLGAAGIAAGVVLTTGSILASMKSVPKFADGGVPTRGSLFIANEEGPELVGNIGGENAVANNDMIVTAIREASYLGFKKAMSEENEKKRNDKMAIDLSFSNLSDSKIARALAPALKLESRRGGKI